MECRIYGASRISRDNIDSLIEWCNTGVGMPMLSYHSKNINKDELLEFIDIARPFLERQTDMQIRTEYNHFNLFCKDPKVLEEIDSALHKWIFKISGPTTDEELNFLLEAGQKKILRDSLPKNGFKFKVYLKTSVPVGVKESFVKWCELRTDSVQLAKTTKRWLENGVGYVQSPFINVKDEKSLSMVSLFLSGYIRKVQEMVLREDVI